MSEINVDLTDLTVKRRRIFKGFRVDSDPKSIEVDYYDIQYTGTIGQSDYKELKRDLNKYESDYDTWLASDEGQVIKAAIEANLALDVPGTPPE